MEDFRIHKLIYSEIKSVYPELFKRIFKEDSSTQIPSYVYVGFVKEEYVGLISAYIHNANSLYISFAGFVDKFKGYRAVILFKQVIEFIHKEFDNIILRIANDNFPALKMALSIKMKIIGIRVDGDCIFVEFLGTKDGKENI